jgi:sigma-70-like protein
LEALVPFVRGLVRRGFARLEIGSADVEDVVQETLLAIHLKRHTWHHCEAITPWVTAIARHKLIDGLRRRGRHREIPIDDLVNVLPAGENNEDRRPDQGARCGSRITAGSETNATKPIGRDHRRICRFAGATFDSFGSSSGYHHGTYSLALRPEMGCNPYAGNCCHLGRITALEAHCKIARRSKTAPSTRGATGSRYHF